MKIFIFGNSITQGFFDTERGGWANRIAISEMQKSVDTDFETQNTVFNLGISGGNTDGLRERVGTELKARLREEQKSIVLFALGINDSQYDMETGENRIGVSQFESNLREAVRQAKEHSADVVHVGIPFVDDSKLTPMPWKTTHGYSNDHINKYIAIQKKLSEEGSDPFIPLADVFDDYELDEVLADGIHPTAKGHELMFKRVQSELERLNIL